MNLLKTILLLSATLLFCSGNLFAGAKDDPLLIGAFIDQLEVRDSESSNPLVVDMQGWLGKDLNKLWLKSELERADGETEEAELQALYSKGISTFWDFQIGVRKDFKPSPTRNWAVLGFQGLSPYFFEIDTALFLGEEGQAALRLEAEYELLFTQKVILSPEVSVNVYSKEDLEIGIGKGISDSEVGLRLRYEIYRELAPYFGVNWVKKYGDTADYAKLAGDSVSDTQAVVGVRFWF